MESLEFKHTTGLQSWDNILPSLTYYGSRKDIGVCYVSDLHLTHHLQYYPSRQKMVRSISKKLVNSIVFDPICRTKIILFCGDTCSDYGLSCDFYRAFMLRMKYQAYKLFKKRNAPYFEISKSQIYYQHLSDIQKLRDNIEYKRALLSKYLDCDKLLCRYSYFNDFTKYLASRYYEKRNFPQWVKSYLIGLFLLTEKLCQKERHLKYIEDFKDANSIVKTVDFDLSMFKHTQYATFVVLGNHEYLPFENIKSAVSAYENALSPLGIRLLHNNFICSDHVLMFGGTGFAKYNSMWNANNLVCYSGFTRKDEVSEGNHFEEKYQKALSFAKEHNLCLICATHYPNTDCLPNTDSEVVYFSGHNHRNEYIKTSEKLVFADNQIGYTNNDIFFKSAAWGLDTNPYHSLSDGLYETDVQEYQKFYRYIGEYIGEGNLIRKRSENCKMYVIKSNGFYGFFIVNSKYGISILNGGTTKRIASATNIEWIVENFNIVVEKYLHAMAPLRNRQEFLSSQLKKCGFDGTIHGCIVDVDFYNHISVDPITGELSFYYSPTLGKMHTYSSFPEMLSSMVQTARLSEENRKKLESSIATNILLPEGNVTHPLVKAETNEVPLSMQQISLADGFYAESRFISPLQRLFTGRVLRRFDITLAETTNVDMPIRRYRYTGRLVYYKDVRYIVEADNGRDVLKLTEIGELADFSDDICKMDKTGFSSKHSINISLLDLKSEMQKPNNFSSYWITYTAQQTQEKYPEIYEHYKHLIT